MSQILIFGASTTQGLWDLEGGWPQRLRAYFDEQYIHKKRSSKIYVFNLGVSGDSSKEILERFEEETKRRLRHPKTLFIFGFGSNDSHFLNDKQRSKTLLDDFARNITTIIQRAKKYSDHIVFVGFNPVDEARTVPIPWEPNVSFKNDLLKQYGDIVKDICEKEKVFFIEIFNEFIKADYKKYLEDGLHPNSEGHKKIFEIVRDFLISKNIIDFL